MVNGEEMENSVGVVAGVVGAAIEEVRNIDQDFSFTVLTMISSGAHGGSPIPA
jgi:hypothetical protein